MAVLAAGIGSAYAAELIDAGRTLYRTGQRSDGTTIAATVQKDVPVAATSSACIGCHRRSGLGTSEGAVRSLPVTAAALFRPASAAAPRPAYDDATLRRAMTQGIAAGGRTLNALMPRYRLTDDDARALTAYLRTLGAAPAPGLTGTDIELATIVAADAPEGDRRAVEQVLERYVQIKNSGTRREADRAAAAQRHPLGISRDRAFRRWRLMVWTLTGPASSWDAQLREYYSRKPPFALLSGTTGHDWSVVHEFCERQELPCILPITDVPSAEEVDFYSLYYTAGVRLEARVTARHVATALHERATRILLLYSDDERGNAAAAAFRDAWRAPELPPLIERRIARDSVPSYREWQKLIGLERPDLMIAWLAAPQFQTLTAVASSTQLLPRRIYTAESFTKWTDTAALPAFRNRVWHVSPYQLPVAGRSQFPREETWLKSQGLTSLDRHAAARVLFACHVLGEGLAAIEGNFSRDFLLEQLEHMLDGTAMTSIFPNTTLGPGQRFVSRGAYVVRLAKGAGRSTPDAQWIQP